MRAKHAFFFCGWIRHPDCAPRTRWKCARCGIVVVKDEREIRSLPWPWARCDGPEAGWVEAGLLWIERAVVWMGRRSGYDCRAR